jgi:hypothetical protein
VLNEQQTINNKQTKVMNRKFLTMIAIAATLMIAAQESAEAQVTVGSDAPPHIDALLDLKQLPDSTATKGLLLPRVRLRSMDAPFPMSRHTQGMVVYNLTDSADVKPGYYFNDGEKWHKATFNADTAAHSGSASPWRVAGTTTPATDNLQDIYQMGRVSVGYDGAPDPSAVFTVSADNKGVLLPKVQLSSSHDVTTIPDPAVGLLVYNEGTPTFPVQGYLYWNGSEWMAFTTNATMLPDARLACATAYLDPEQAFNIGVPILPGSVMRVPYTNGNGGMFRGVTLTSFGNPGITATLNNGRFENGSGYLAFVLEGTPSPFQIPPYGIRFDLTPFYDANPSITRVCTQVVVGLELKAELVSVALIDNLKFTNEAGVWGYGAQMTTPDGKFSVRCFIVSRDWDNDAENFGTNNWRGMNLQIRNNMNYDVSIAGNYRWEYQGMSGGSATNLLGLQPHKWSGNNDQNSTRQVWANWLDGDVTNNTANNPDDNRDRSARFIYWGNPGIYADGTPERRVYSWTVNDGAQSKISYMLTFSSAALTPSVPANNVSCPGGICLDTKVFMKIDQITAP